MAWGKQILCTMQDHMGVTIRNRVNKEGLGEVNLVGSRGWGDPWFHQEDVHGLLE